MPKCYLSTQIEGNNKNKMIKYQNYLHYKLPITMIPAEFGTIIEQFSNKYIVQLSTTNVVVIKEVDNENFIRFFRKGELMFEFKDTKISENTFTRTIFDQKFTFEKNKLISTEILILSRNSYISIYNSNTPYTKLQFIFLIYLIFFAIFPETEINMMLVGLSTNIIKLRRVASKHV
jgi:hypothetical protein